MKLALVYLFAISIIVHVYGQSQDNNTDTPDNVNKDQSSNESQLKQYVDCILQDEPDIKCPEEILDLKKIYHKFYDNCADCNKENVELMFLLNYLTTYLRSLIKPREEK